MYRDTGAWTTVPCWAGYISCNTGAELMNIHEQVMIFMRSHLNPVGSSSLRPSPLLIEEKAERQEEVELVSLIGRQLSVNSVHG